ncbi:MAG: NCS2 family permease [Victivallales bacterium]|nr:NCS2 family permease [Victivallales bacterium]
MNFLERFFKIRENNTTIRREIYAGSVSFLAVAYILAVNPAILSETGMPQGGVLCATALAGFAGTLAMSLLANAPLVLAPAMGLNAFFAYTVVIGMGFSWQLALFAVFLEGIIFILLSATSLRSRLIDAIPMQLKYAMGAGIGLFITLIAFKSAHIVEAHPATLITMHNFTSDSFGTSGISAVLAFAGILFTGYMFHKRVPGALLLGIFVTWLCGIYCEITGIYEVNAEKGFYSMIPSFSLDSYLTPFREFAGTFCAAFQTDNWQCTASTSSGWSLLFSLDFLIVCFAFLFTDFFDTVGTVNGAVVNTPLMKEDGTIPRLKQIMLADSIATFTGAILGTSTTTTFAESAAGINAGARTGMAALSASLLFLLSLLLSPVFMAIPGFATAPALVVVGLLMAKALCHIDLNQLSSAIPAYLLIAGTVFTYSVSDGLGMGIISWTLLNCLQKGKVNIFMWVITILFILKYILL